MAKKSCHRHGTDYVDGHCADCRATWRASGGDVSENVIAECDTCYPCGACIADYDALLAERDEANDAAARALAAADVERDRFDALREAGDAAIRTADDALTAALDDTGQLDWCAARDDYYSCKRAWRAATGEGA